MTKLKELLFRHVSWKEAVMTFVGAFCGIGGCGLLAYLTDLPLIIAPFGASAVLIYSAVSSPLAQPRNVIGGHLIAAFVAISCCKLLGDSWYVMALAVSLAILAMMATGTLHPPGGATALLCVLQGTDSYFFMLLPLVPGVAILLTAAILSSKIFPGVRPYPWKAAGKKQQKEIHANP
ncbi:MAG: HPP family protein [Bacillota bacterium]|jgi:CBS domain-containing membrane protein